MRNLKPRNSFKNLGQGWTNTAHSSIFMVQERYERKGGCDEKRNHWAYKALYHCTSGWGGRSYDGLTPSRSIVQGEWFLPAHGGKVHYSECMRKKLDLPYVNPIAPSHPRTLRPSGCLGTPLTTAAYLRESQQAPFIEHIRLSSRVLVSTQHLDSNSDNFS